MGFHGIFIITLVATPKPLSRSASPHIPNQQTTSLASAAKVSLSESSSDSSSSGRYINQYFLKLNSFFREIFHWYFEKILTL